MPRYVEREHVTDIEKWRKNAYLSRANMHKRLDIPIRTIENWEFGEREPAPWAKRLLIAELMRIAEAETVERARKRMNRLKQDANGNRPVGSWAVVMDSGSDQMVDTFPTMQKAIDGYEFIKNDTFYDKVEVGYVICNETENGLQPFYEDYKGNIEAEYDIIEL